MLNQMQRKTLLKVLRDEIDSEKLEEIIVNMNNSGKLIELMDLKNIIQEDVVYNPNYCQKLDKMRKGLIE